MTVRVRGSELSVGHPCVDGFIAHDEREPRRAIVLIEVLHGDVERSSRTLIAMPRAARAARRTGGGLPGGCCLPGDHGCVRVAFERHRLGFHASWEAAGAPDRIRNAGDPQEPVVDRITPDDGMPGLILEPGEHRCVPLTIDQPLEPSPPDDEAGCLVRPLVVRVVDVLNDRLAGSQHVCVRNVVEEQEQLVRRRGT